MSALVVLRCDGCHACVALDEPSVADARVAARADGWDFRNVHGHDTDRCDRCKSPLLRGAVSDYVCAECDEPIADENPHTRADGEDVHAFCCVECAGASS